MNPRHLGATAGLALLLVSSGCGDIVDFIKKTDDPFQYSCCIPDPQYDSKRDPYWRCKTSATDSCPARSLDAPLSFCDNQPKPVCQQRRSFEDVDLAVLGLNVGGANMSLRPRSFTADIPSAERFLPVSTRFRTATSSQSATAPLSSKSMDCRAHCSSGDEYCLAASLPAEPSSAISATVQRAFSRPATIKRADMLREFKVPKDPCERSDTNLRSGQFINSGKDCVVRDTSSAGNAIRLPAQLAGTWSAGTGRVTLEFPNPLTAPSLQFGDAATNAYFGGWLRRAELSNADITIEAGAACVQVLLSKR